MRVPEEARSIRPNRGVLSLVLLGLIVPAWPLDVEFTAEVAVPVGSLNEIRALEALPDGGFVVAGPYSLPPGAATASFVVRLDARGRQVWLKTFGGEGDTLRQVRATPDGGFYAVGDCGSKGAGGRDIWVLRTDAEGNLLWERTFGGKDFEYGFAAMAVPGGGLAVAGSTSSFRVDTSGFNHNGTWYYWDYVNTWFLRLNAGGDTLSTSLIEEKGGEAAYAMAPGPESGFYLAGGTVPKSGRGWETVLRLDAGGRPLWSAELAASLRHGDPVATAIVSIPGTGAYVAGLDGYLSDEVSIAKVGEDGTVAWRHTLHHQRDGRPTGLADLGGGHLAISTRNSLHLADTSGGAQAFAIGGRVLLAMVKDAEGRLTLAGSRDGRGWLGRPGMGGRAFPGSLLDVDTLEATEVDLQPSQPASARDGMLWKTEIGPRQQEKTAVRMAAEGVGPAFRLRMYAQDPGLPALEAFHCFGSDGKRSETCSSFGLPLEPDPRPAPFKSPLALDLPKRRDDGGYDYRRYHVAGTDQAVHVWHTSLNGCTIFPDGGSACAANLGTTAGGNFDPVIVVRDDAGRPRWARRYRTPGSEYANSIQRTSDGGYLLSGASTSFGPRLRIILLKTDSLGGPQAFRTLSYADLASLDGFNLPEGIEAASITVDGKTYPTDVEGVQAMEMEAGKFLLLASNPRFDLPRMFFLVRLDMPVPMGTGPVIAPRSAQLSVRGGRSFLQLNSGVPGPMEVELRTLGGVRVGGPWRVRIGAGETRIPVQKLPAGVYLATVRRLDGQAAAGRHKVLILP